MGDRDDDYLGVGSGRRTRGSGSRRRAMFEEGEYGRITIRVSNRTKRALEIAAVMEGRNLSEICNDVLEPLSDKLLERHRIG